MMMDTTKDSTRKISDVFREWRHGLRANQHITALVMIVLMGGLSYASSFLAGFQFDDYSAIVNNPVIKHLNLPVLWDHYKVRFVTNLSFAANYSLFGLNVLGWHVINFCVHAATAFFAYLLTLLTLQSPKLKDTLDQEDRYAVALFSALVFLVHPIQTQAVTYIVQRATALAGLFYLGAVYFYARARFRDHTLSYLGAFIFVLLGALTKPIVITLPAMIILYDFCFLSSEQKTKFRRSFTWVLLVLPVVAIPFLLVGKTKLNWESLQAIQGYGALSPLQYLWTQFTVTLTYLRLLFLPVNQNLDYDYRVASHFLEPSVLLSGIILAVILIAALIMLRRQRLVAFGILWFFIALSSQSSIVPLLDVIYEHRVYLACYGFSLFLCVTIYKICRNTKRYIALMSFVVGLLAVLTYQRNVVWSDPLLFMKDVVAKSPEKARPHNNLGFFYFTEGRLSEAEGEYVKAIRLDPDYFVAQNNLGTVYYEEGKILEAREVFEKLIARYPDYPDPYVGLGLVYQSVGKPEIAFQLFRQNIQLYPDSAAGYIGLGNIYQVQGDMGSARLSFEKAAWLNPDSASAHYNLGNVYFKQGRLYEALIRYQRAVRIRPNFAQAFNNIGNIFFYFNEYGKAAEQYKKAIEQDPLLTEGYLNLANALYETGYIVDSKRFASAAAQLYRQQGNTAMAEGIEKKLSTHP